MLYIEKLGFDCKYKVRFEIGSGSPGLQIDDRTCGNLIGQLATASTIAKAPRVNAPWALFEAKNGALL